jgi:sulfate adenylyltransferase
VSKVEKKTGCFSYHGGIEKPINRVLSHDEANEIKERAGELITIGVNAGDLPTIKRIGDGALSPLTGPMNSEVYKRVLTDENIVSNGGKYAWSIPISFRVTDQEADALKEKKGKKEAILLNPTGEAVGYLEVEDVFPFDSEFYLKTVYDTNRVDHPGAFMVLNDERKTMVGGLLSVFPTAYEGALEKYILPPEKTRALFKEKKWERIIAFQTRNPLHRAHEYAMVIAIERLTREGHFAGVVLNPLLGELKSDDVPAEVRMQCYRALHDGRLLGKGDKDESLWEQVGYDINDQFELLGLEIKMFYAGPKEAVMHAIYRQNYGFSDIIIGRKHADAPFDDGTPIWGDFDAHEKFENLTGELLINNLNIGFAAYYEELGKVGLVAVESEKGLKPVTISGTVLRETLGKGEIADERFIRPEVSKILIEYYKGIRSGK